MSARPLTALAIAALGALAPVTLAAQGTPPQPRFERVVVPGVAGPNRLALDVPLLAGGAPFEVSGTLAMRPGVIARGGLGDLRLYDATDREVPYLLVPPAEREPIWRTSGRIARVTPGKDTSGFEVDLGGVVPVDRLEVMDLPPRFLKRVRLEGSGDRARWTQLVGEGTLFNLPGDEQGGAPLRQAQLAFAPGAYRYLRVIWDDHAGARLPTPLQARARIADRGAPAIDTLRAALGFERRPSARRTTRYHVKLPGSRLPIVALDLDVGEGNVLRAATVTEPRLAGGQVSPVRLGEAQLRRAEYEGAVASNLRIPIDAPNGAELDVVIDDGDNPPLDLRGITAVFAPLPYLYFESAKGDTLRARYGRARREPVPGPRYDLEAIRDTVREIATAEARWGAPHPTGEAQAGLEAPAALHAAAGAPLDVSTFAYARASPAGSGFTAVRLDAAALAHSRVDDVRIVDDKGRQIPYLLETVDEPLELQLAAPQPTAPRQDVDQRLPFDAASRTWYRLQLPYGTLPEATLRLRTEARVFARDVDLVTRHTLRDAASYESATRLAGATWTHDDPDAPAPPLEIALPRRLETDSLFLLVNDGDNQKLPLGRPTLLLPTYRLRFFRPAGSALTLVYGRPGLGAPRYDLALIAPRLLDAPAEEVTPAAERRPGAAQARTPQLVFWGVLVVAVIALLVLIARLVHGGAEPAAAPTDAAPVDERSA